ncbi:MAG: alcohol dehydrogenase family protein, partial [Ilumatobacter sp.]|uniref:alcohol dehydrogenase family protein n=1 Tax=Ilumatobacter sp. TaxID=1967498 RepID=UPI00329965C7
YRTDVPVPTARSGEVLVNVRAAGVNNTDINTRVGWYSKSVNSGTSDGLDTSDAESVVSSGDSSDAPWSGAVLAFPRIQGADVCGVIMAVGGGIAPARIGERVLLRSMAPVRDVDESLVPFEFTTLGAERDGGFAQFVVADSVDAIAVDSDWSDVELGSIPCASSTAENMLRRAQVGAERVLITGASGGVGSALVQLASRRGAEVIAVCSAAKSDAVRELGASRVVDRDGDLLTELGSNSIDVVADLVAGPQWPGLLDVLRPGGRYVTSGAIAGPITELDVRSLYLKDLSLLGATYQPPHVFTDLVGYVERDEIRPIVATTLPLSEIADAQREFMSKRHVGKIVLVPPPVP